MQGYKVTDNKRTRRIGIAANSLKMLKERAEIKFSIRNSRIYLSKDGFEVCDEQYFKTIPAQTLFIIGEMNEDIVTDSEYEFNKIKSKSPLLQISNIVTEFIENNPEKFKEILMKCEKRLIEKNLLTTKQNRTHLSHRNDDKEWFDGLDKNFKTKEEILSKKAQDRFKGYYYKTKDEITKHNLYRTNIKAKKIFEKILEKFRFLLISCNYFSVIFDRKYEKKHPQLLNINDDQIDAGYAIPNKKLRLLLQDYAMKNHILNEWLISLCTYDGDFFCQGAFSERKMKNKKNNGYNCNQNYTNYECCKRHTINPYSSKENRILFQIWNLDHQIEITRTIIPSIINNVKNMIDNPKQKCPEHNRTIIDISIIEYFLELFSLKNLKLVHIVCHEKVQRINMRSNGKLICDECDEYSIIKDLDNISCPEEDIE